MKTRYRQLDDENLLHHEDKLSQTKNARVNLNDLLERIKTQKKQEKATNVLVIFYTILVTLIVFLIFSFIQ